MKNKRVCGARCKRTGKPCQNRPTNACLSGRPRCRFHGGSPRQPKGVGHPGFKHGRYSKDPVARMVGERMAREEAEARAEDCHCAMTTPAPTPAPEVHQRILDNVAQGKADWIADLGRAARGNVPRAGNVTPSDQGKAKKAKEEVGRAESRA